MTLGISASLIHLKMKYHNIHDEYVMIHVDLSRVLYIHKPLQCSQDTTMINNKKNDQLEVNVVDLR